MLAPGAEWYPRLKMAAANTHASHVAPSPPGIPPPQHTHTHSRVPILVVHETFDGDEFTQGKVDVLIGQLDRLCTTDAGLACRVVFPSLGKTHHGFGTKAITTIGVLEEITSDTPDLPVVVMDARDVLLNGKIDAAGLLARYRSLTGRKGTMTSTSFLTISRGFFSPAPPHTRRML